MYLDSAKKKELFEKYGKSATNTGSAESQIALFTFRISHLTEHLKVNHKDYATERSLKMLVGKRPPTINQIEFTSRIVLIENAIQKQRFSACISRVHINGMSLVIVSGKCHWNKKWF